MSSEQLLQVEIDFLPARYREECAQRKTHFWRVVSVIVFSIGLLSLATVQWHKGRKVILELEAIAPIHDRAHERTVQLTTLKKELASATARAELLTYLQHPWPRTQLLAAVFEPMPESIKLSELTIGRPVEDNTEVVLPSQAARNSGAVAAGAEETKVTLSPASADLKTLRSEFDPRTTVVLMAGETTDVSELHEYLGEIADHPLILKAELRSIESGGRDSLATLFRARIEVRPGYGQPDGPTAPPETKQPTESAAGASRQASQVDNMMQVLAGQISREDIARSASECISCASLVEEISRLLTGPDTFACASCYFYRQHLPQVVEQRERDGT